MLTSLHRKESTPDSPAVSLTGVNNSTVDRCMHRQHACCLGMLAAWHPVSDACNGPQPHPQRIGGPARASNHITWHGPGGGCIGSTGYLSSPTPPTLCTCPPGKTSHPIPMNPLILLKAVHPPPSHHHEPGSPTSVDRGALFALWKRSRCISFCRLSCGPDPLISVHFGFVFDLRCGIVFVLRFAIPTEAIRPYGT